MRKFKNLKESVIVVTGASSGIGQAAALKFASYGASVVLAARSDQQLKVLAQECIKIGGNGIAVSGDLRDENSVREIAKRAIETFGKIDVWVNNAAVTSFGRLDEIPMDVIRRVIETNIFGYIHGARAAIHQFREQGYGILINVSSIVGLTGSKYVAPYSLTKAAINNLSNSLRMELMDNPNIHVCNILAASHDTPLFEHAANYSGREIKPMSPVFSAEMVANAIVELAVHPRREVVLGSATRLIKEMINMAPGKAEKIFAHQIEKDHFQNRPAEVTTGNLFEPMREWNNISGGWNHDGERLQIIKRSACGMILLAGLGALVWKLTGRNNKHRPWRNYLSMAHHFF